MKVTVKVIGPLVYKVGFSLKEFSCPPQTRLKDLLDQLKIPEDKPLVITRNGIGAQEKEVLEEGDRIVIAPVYSGG